MEKQNYLLQVGTADFKRMNALSNIYMPYNTKFIMDHGLKEGMSVADVGCGPGLVSLWLADKVGLQGNVTAIDASADQLAILEQQVLKDSATQTMEIDASQGHVLTPAVNNSTRSENNSNKENHPVSPANQL